VALCVDFLPSPSIETIFLVAHRLRSGVPIECALLPRPWRERSADCIRTQHEAGYFSTILCPLHRGKPSAFVRFITVIIMRKRFLVLALALWGCGQTPPPTPAPVTSAPAKTAPVSAPVASAPTSTPEATPQRDLVSAVTANGVESAQGMGDPEKAKALSSKIFKNTKLLGDISGDRFMASMQSMRANLGEDCEFCHKANDFSSDANKHKVISRTMMEMSFAINRDHFDNKLKVSCYTCHRGHEEPLKTAMPAEKPKKDELANADMKKPSSEVFQNVQVLKGLPAGELKPLMKKFNDALGVRCDFCHVKEKFESDDKAEKKAAREMIKMVTTLNKTYFPKKKAPAITCDTCHRGAKEPAVNVGPKLILTATVTGQKTWSAVFGIATWPTLPTTRGEMRAALEAIPVNQALTGMLLSMDTGEMGRLPPGDYRVCGFALPTNKDTDKLKTDRPVTCQPLTITASPDTQTAKLELPAP
jgi:Photosynthetic reaction centre cytochrome C subunit